MIEVTMSLITLLFVAAAIFVVWRAISNVVDIEPDLTLYPYEWAADDDEVELKPIKDYRLKVQINCDASEALADLERARKRTNYL